MNANNPHDDEIALPVDLGRLEPSDPARGLGSPHPKIKHYLILEKPYQGEFGAIYRAIHEGPERNEVAIKTISVGAFEWIQPEKLERFLREIELLRKAQHRAVLPIQDSGKYVQAGQSIPFIVMPWIQAGDFSDVLRRHAWLTQDRFRKTIEAIAFVCDGLQHLHDLGIVHRDIKPANLLVAEESRLLIADFGIAKFDDPAGEVSRVFGFTGTELYAAPEQSLPGSAVDHRADLYAVGVILYELVCGARPFQGDEAELVSSADRPSESKSSVDRFSESKNSVARLSESKKNDSERFEIAKRHQFPDRMPTPPSRRDARFADRRLDHVILKCVEYDPRHRYVSAADLAADLRRWLSGQSVRRSFRERARVAIIRPAKRNHRLVGFTIFALVFAAAAGFVYQNWQREGDFVGQIARRDQLLREEFDRLVPRLRGGPLWHETRRLRNSLGRNRENLVRVATIAESLDLKHANDPGDALRYWMFRFLDRPPRSADLSPNLINELLEIADRNLNAVQANASATLWDRREAFRAWIRTHRLAAINAVQNDRMDRAETFKQTMRRQLQSAGDLDRDSKQLAELTIAVLDCLTADDRWKWCQSHQNLFSPESLAGNREPRAWYQAWFLFQFFHQSALETEQSREEILRITQAWLRLQKGTPVPDPESNVTFLEDLNTVLDFHADALREAGQIEAARDIYEESWANCQLLMRFYRDEDEIWVASQQVASSLKRLASRTNDRELFRIACEREIRTLRGLRDCVDRRVVPGERPEIWKEAMDDSLQVIRQVYLADQDSESRAKRIEAAEKLLGRCKEVRHVSEQTELTQKWLEEKRTF